MRRMLHAAFLLALTTSARADVIYHFQPYDLFAPTVQLDFSPSLPVSGTSGWTLPEGIFGPGGIYYGDSIGVTIYGLPEYGVFAAPYAYSTSARVILGGVTSDTGATLDSGEISAIPGFLFDIAFYFGPGGVGSEGFEYYNGPPSENPTHGGVGAVGVWLLGPASLPIPEPPGAVLLGLGLAGVGAAAWRRRFQSTRRMSER